MSNIEITIISIKEIQVQERLREISDITHLKESIKTSGLQTPIIVRELKQKDTPHPYILIDGNHRLTAYKELGCSDIPAIIQEVSEEEASLLEIDTNLMRKELTVIEKAEHLKRREEIYYRLHPEAQPTEITKKNLKQNQSNNEKEPSIKSFTTDTAKRCNKSQRSVQQLIQITKKIIPDLLKLLKKSDIADNLTKLLNIAKYPEHKQEELYNAILEGNPESLNNFIKTYSFTSNINDQIKNEKLLGCIEQSQNELIIRKETLSEKREELSQKTKEIKKEIKEIDKEIKMVEEALKKNTATEKDKISTTNEKNKYPEDYEDQAKETEDKNDDTEDDDSEDNEDEANETDEDLEDYEDIDNEAREENNDYITDDTEYNDYESNEDLANEINEDLEDYEDIDNEAREENNDYITDDTEDKYSETFEDIANETNEDIEDYEDVDNETKEEKEDYITDDTEDDDYEGNEDEANEIDDDLEYFEYCEDIDNDTKEEEEEDYITDDTEDNYSENFEDRANEIDEDLEDYEDIENEAREENEIIENSHDENEYDSKKIANQCNETEENEIIEDNDDRFITEELDENGMLLKPFKTKIEKNGKTDKKRKSYIYNGYDIPLKDEYLAFLGLPSRIKEIIKIAKEKYDLDLTKQPSEKT